MGLFLENPYMLNVQGLMSYKSTGQLLSDKVESSTFTSNHITPHRLADIMLMQTEKLQTNACVLTARSLAQSPAYNVRISCGMT